MAKEWDETFETFDELIASEWNDHVTDQKNHSGRHEDGGTDELDVTGLAGELADPQTPQTEAVQDIVNGLLSAGGNIGLTYDDPNDTLTIDTTALNEEEVEDAVANLVTAGNAITVNYDDPNDSLSIAVDESSLSFYDGTNLTANVDNQSLSTEDVSVGSSPDRHLISNESQTINVPNDYSTLQEAVNQIPHLVRHTIRINVDSGTYNEDVLVPPFVGGDQADGTPQSGFPTGRVEIVGDTATPSNVEVDSFTFAGFQSVQTALNGFKLLSNSPYDDQSVCVVAYSANELWANNLVFGTNSGDIGVLSYSGHAQVKNCDFSNLVKGVYAKREATVSAQSNTGTTTGDTYFAGNGGQVSVWDNSATSSGSSKYGSIAGGVVMSADDGLAEVSGANQSDGLSLTAVPDYYLRDDFGDNALTDRSGRVRHPYPEVGLNSGVYRPEWKITDGSPSASNGAASLGDTDRIVYGPASDLGPWEFSYRASSLTTNDEQFQIHFIRQNADNWIRLEIKEGGGFNLVKNESGTTTVLDNSASWPADTNLHSVTIRRVEDPEENRYIISLDGTEKINLTDSFVPSPNEVWLYNFWNNPVYIPEVKFG